MPVALASAMLLPAVGALRLSSTVLVLPAAGALAIGTVTYWGGVALVKVRLVLTGV